MPDNEVPGWFDHVRVPLVLIEADGSAVSALNANAVLLFATEALPLSASRLEDLIGANAAAVLIASMVAHSVADGPAPLVKLPCMVDGRARHLEIASSRLQDGRWLLTIDDRTAEREATSKLSALEDDLHEIMEAIPIGIEIYDREDNCLFVNAYGAGILGYGADELLQLEDWWPTAYPDPAYRKMAYAAWEAGLRESRASIDHVHMAEWFVACKDGTQKLIHFRLRSLGDNSVLVYWDVTDQGRLVKQLRHLADTDDLTGAGNRRRFQQEAQALITGAQRSGAPVALLMIDIDLFKLVNDHFGHAAGDLVLQSFVDRCRRVLRDQDLLARMGGEEFAVLLPGFGPMEALRTAETLRHFIAGAPMLAEGVPIPVTVSIGLSWIAAGAPDREADHGGAEEALSGLMRRADRALYGAKRGGRNRVVSESTVSRPEDLPA